MQTQMRYGVVMVCLAVVIAMISVSPAWAMTIRHDRDDQLYRDFANEHAYGGALTGLYVGSGTLISPSWVLTAAHVLSGVTTFRTSVGNFQVVETIKHPTLDFGLARLGTAIHDIEPVKLYSLDYGIDHGRDAVIMGAGLTGTGLTGQISGTSGARRAGQTYVFANGSAFGWSSTEVHARFRSPSAGAHHLEAGFTNGDSGGGLLFEVNGEYAIAGVLTTAWRVDGKTYGEYSTGGGYTRSALLNDWILSYATDALIIGQQPPHPDLKAYDGFNYAAGQALEGRSGGLGWPTSPLATRRSWQYSHAMVAEGSLAYTDARGNVLVTGGNHVRLAAPSSSTNARATRWLTETDDDPMLGSTGESVWISYLAQPNGDANTNLQLGHGNATVSSNRRLIVGGLSGTWALQAAADDGNRIASTGMASNLAAFVVVRLDFPDPNDVDGKTNVYLWLNPLLHKTPGADTADAVLMDLQADYTFNHLHFFQSRLNWENDPFLFDELRIGLSFESVAPMIPIPEPTTLALSGVGALLILLRRRAPRTMRL